MGDEGLPGNDSFSILCPHSISQQYLGSVEIQSNNLFIKKRRRRPSYRKVKWTSLEDDLLRESVRVNGDQNWIIVSSMIPERNAKQCRERWKTQIDPELNKNEWKPEEDEILISIHEQIGNSWAEIAPHLPGRSPMAVKNRFSWLSNKNRIPSTNSKQKSLIRGNRVPMPLISRKTCAPVQQEGKHFENNDRIAKSEIIQWEIFDDDVVNEMLFKSPNEEYIEKK